MSMSNYPTQDFRYRKDMSYDNIKTTPSPYRKKTIKRDSGLGRVCKGCGMTRSLRNKCFCNED